MKKIWDTQALQALCGELDQGFHSVTHHVAHLGSQGAKPLVHEGVPGGMAAIFCGFFQYDIPRGEVQQDQPMRSKQVLSTAPMISYPSLVATLSFFQVAAVSKIAASNVCITRRKAEEEQPICVAGWSRAKNSCIVSIPTPRLSPNV